MKYLPNVSKIVAKKYPNKQNRTSHHIQIPHIHLISQTHTQPSYRHLIQPIVMLLLSCFIIF